MQKKKKIMKGLTAKEEEIMGFFWEKGPLFVKEMLAFYDDPKPHFNTLSTIVRGLEEKGYLSHKAYGNTYQYYATVSRDDCHQQILQQFLPGCRFIAGERGGHLAERAQGADTEGRGGTVMNRKQIRKTR